MTPSRPPRAALQGRLQARPQTHRHQHWQLGIACRGSQRLASNCAGRSQKRRGEEKQTDGRETNEEETETGFQPSDPIHLHQLWQRLSCQDWTPEPLQPLLSTSLRTNQGAYHCLSRQTVAYYYHRSPFFTDCLHRTAVKEREMTSSISSLVRIWKIRHSGPGCSFV